MKIPQFIPKDRRSQDGIALVITLIMLAVTLVMAVAFLALARRERNSVTTTTDTTVSRLAADSAVANAQGQIVASIASGFNGLDSGNAYNLHLLVSTNYINPQAFIQSGGPYGSPSPTNVNYLGPFADGDQRNQNIANLYFLPRPPVFITTNGGASYDFRYYLDLNENGQFDTNGMQVNFDAANNIILDGKGNPVVTFQTGDPEWVGVLEHPDQPHGPNNHFTARYAFAAVPIGNALDLNYIHNQAYTVKTDTSSAAPGDYFSRNQGVGSWELNLAAFLADLNTNIWGANIGPPSSYYQYNEPNNKDNGYAFDDARAILAYRYNKGSLTNALTTLGNAASVFRTDQLDEYSVGSFQYTLDTNTDFLLPNNPAQPWSGSDNPNHFFSISDLLNPTLGLGNFTNRLQNAGFNNDTYDRYTFYRMLDEIGTDSSGDDGKMNLNYSNAVVTYYTNNGVIIPMSESVITGAETNLAPWTPQNFFITAADQMLRLYTKEWFQSDPSNYLYTYYGYIPQGYVDPSGFGVTNFPNYGQINQIPTFGITNIPVMINGRFVYSPAINRLLQLAANLYDASTGTNFNLPHVFRPIFEHDSLGNVFIDGYTSLYSVNGPNTVNPGSDPQLSTPIAPEQLANYGPAYTPITTNGGLVNVYGVPWIIGAKKGLPNFEQFYMLASATVTRKLEVTRSSSDPTSATYGTNQMYIIGISNNLGVTFWNSYNASYSPHGSLQVYASDTVNMTLTNGNPQSWSVNRNFSSTQTLPSWPGSQWAGTPPTVTANPNSYLPITWNYIFQSPLSYNFGTGLFDPTIQWDPVTPSVPISQLSQFGLLITNYLQAYILDGNNVIDYVQLRDPITQGGLNQALADPNYPAPLPNNNIYYQWSTNYYPSAPPTPYGVINQLWVSGHPGDAPAAGGTWDNSPTPEGISTPAAEAAYYNGFFTPTYQGTDGKTYQNISPVQQAPYTPSRTVFVPYLLQANDPLVHYLSSDLNSQVGTLAGWANAVSGVANGIWTNTDSQATLSPPPKIVNSTTAALLDRYQPWGRLKQMAGLTGVDGNSYNLAYKDPLAWYSDSWDFPTNAYPTVGWIGRVHRGTPWQTVDLKATNILLWAQGAQNIGTNTWANWTGDIQKGLYGQYYDAVNHSPLQDRLLFDIFTTRFNDNSARGTLPVNVGAGTPDGGLAAWSALFSGMEVLANNAVVDLKGQYFCSYSNLVINPAGPSTTSALNTIVNNINAVRADSHVFPYGAFTHVGDVLEAPALSESSPFLGKTDKKDVQYGINDEMYEWIPQQMMGLVRQSTPRYVLYCWGQTLRPAPGGTVLGGPFSQLVTNYQVTAETAVRVVMRIDNSNTGHPHAVVESYNVLPPY
jgi:hypothetical protein